MPASDRVGLVVAGGGARGAYEAGALTKLLPRMAADDAPPTVLVGTSAGALNVVGLAGCAHEGWGEASRWLVGQWAKVTMRQVADVIPSLGQDVVRYLGQLAGLPTRLPSLFDTRVQRKALAHLLPLEQMHDNVASGVIDAVAVAATSIQTGGTVVFLEAGASVDTPDYDAARNIRYVRTRLTIDHVLASAAVPVAFRPVRIGAETPSQDESPHDAAGWYVDGGVRLNVPLKPALKLGCRYLGVVATQPSSWPTPEPTAELGPDIFGASSLILNALLADRMVEDLHTLSKTNSLIAGPITGPTRAREVRFIFAGPPTGQAGALGRLANRAFRECCAEPGAALRHPDLWALNRLIGGTHASHGDLLSFLLFEPAFTALAAELGADHAERSLEAVAPRKANWLTTL